MASTLTPERIAELKDFYKKHPPDPQYDWSDDMLDAVIPPDEFEARCVREILKNLGELPDTTK